MHVKDLSYFLRGVRTKSNKRLRDIFGKPDKMYDFTSKLGYSLIQNKVQENLEENYFTYQWLVTSVIMSDITSKKKETIKNQVRTVNRKYIDHNFTLEFSNHDENN